VNKRLVNFLDWKHLSVKEKVLLVVYGITFLSMFVYSFTQIDLSLTFSRITFLRNLVKSFQYVGYFNRPLSLYIFLFLLVVFYGLYSYFLFLANRKKLTKKYVWKILIIGTVILTFSYNAFSYDIFNYMFDAKIFTYYHSNPYLHMALNYPKDPMLSFMHWTDRRYPYGPFFLVLTVPLSFIGLNLFLPTFFLFKLLMAFSFLGSLLFLGKIFQKIFPEKEIFGLVLFGLNPLILIESLISAHIDILMIFLSLWSFYLLLEKKYIYSFLLFIASIGIKFATGFLIPVYLWIFVLQRINKKIPWSNIFVLSTILMAITAILETQRSNFQPWYLMLVFAFAVFFSDTFFVVIPIFIISFFSLLNYAPFLYLGNWNKPVPSILVTLNLISYYSSFIIVFIYFIYKKIIHEKR